MKPHVALLALAASMIAHDSIADPDAGAGRIVIPERVEEETLPAFDAEPFPEEKSKAPKPDEWKAAPRVRLTRVAPRITECTAYRIREWIKIHCDRKTAGMRLLAGSTEGVALWVAEPLKARDDLTTMGRFAELIFPVRRGDRRVFETFDFDFGYYEGWGIISAIVVEQQWREGAKPEIALLSP